MGGKPNNATVKLPSDKLQISKPFTVAVDGSVSFVFDITIIKTGQSGQYILKPQIGESGAGQHFNDVTPLPGSVNSNKQLLDDKTVGTGKPEAVPPKGKPENPRRP